MIHVYNKDTLRFGLFGFFECMGVVSKYCSSRNYIVQLFSFVILTF